MLYKWNEIDLEIPLFFLTYLQWVFKQWEKEVTIEIFQSNLDNIDIGVPQVTIIFPSLY